MRKKLYILYTDQLKQPDYGYFFPVSKLFADFIRYIFLLNHWDYGMPFPSWLYSIRRWFRKKDYFGYWAAFRRREENKKDIHR